MSSDLLFDSAGNLKLFDIFVNYWSFGFIDFAFLFVLIATTFLLNRYGFRFGQIIGVVFALTLAFATISGSTIMWGIIILIIVASGLRIGINILLRV